MPQLTEFHRLVLLAVAGPGVVLALVAGSMFLSFGCCLLASWTHQAIRRRSQSIERIQRRAQRHIRRAQRELEPLAQLLPNCSRVFVDCGRYRGPGIIHGQVWVNENLQLMVPVMVTNGNIWSYPAESVIPTHRHLDNMKTGPLGRDSSTGSANHVPLTEVERATG